MLPGPRPEKEVQPVKSALMGESFRDPGASCQHRVLYLCAVPGRDSDAILCFKAGVPYSYPCASSVSVDPIIQVQGLSIPWALFILDFHVYS